MEQSEHSQALVAAKSTTPERASLLRPIASPSEFLRAHEENVSLINSVLKEGRDFGIVPYAKKASLFKPGAERLTLAFGLRAEFDILEKEEDHDRVVEYSKRNGKSGTSIGLYRYSIRCRLHYGDRVVGEGVGACSSMESKYIDAPREAENTILKMAKKRAHVDAVLTTLGLSDSFTQDVEDYERGEDDRGQRPRQAAKPAAPQKPKMSAEEMTVRKDIVAELKKRGFVSADDIEAKIRAVFAGNLPSGLDQQMDVLAKLRALPLPDVIDADVEETNGEATP